MAARLAPPLRHQLSSTHYLRELTVFDVRVQSETPGYVEEAQLTVRCLGGFEFTMAGREHDWAKLRPRAQAVLRLLAVRAGQAVHRDHLVVAFWDGV
ncbi:MULTISPECIES: hypothetical protein, partial [Streptomyces]